VTTVLSHSRVTLFSIGIATALFAAVCFAGQPSEVQMEHDRATEQGANTPLRENPLPPVQLQALRNGCPGRVDLAACIYMNMQPPVGAGEIVGTSSSTQGTLTTSGQDVSRLGRK
jgi:hypothetical protein